MGYHEITVKRGEEFQAKQESIYDSNTFFYDAYRQAAACLVEILTRGEEHIKRNRENSGEPDEWLSGSERINRQLLGYPNNIIAFCAERGHGKTSAMASFSTALLKMDRICRDGAQFWESVRRGETDPRAYRYVVIDRIDPTMMEQRDSIVKVILSRMFSRLQGYEKARKRHGDQTTYRRLLERFRECFHNLQTLEQRAENYDDEDELELISELSDSTNMRGAVYGLIREFLEYVCPEEHTCLVLQLDDADLNIGQAYRIIDDIRRYLILPQVVVLLAANMHQLESVVEQDFISRYQVSIQYGGMVSIKQCHNIAARYVDKVIPGVRQIHLPDVDKEIEKSSNRIRLRYLQGKEELLESLEEESAYQEQLLQFLYRRTGLILLHSDRFLHNLLPSGMRELCHFLAFFIDMPKISISYWDLVDAYAGKPSPGIRENLETWRKNLSRLEYYLTELWAPVNLRTEGHDFLRSLRLEPDSSKNRHILWFLPDYYSREQSISNGAQGVSAQESKAYREQFVEACRSRGLEIYDESIAGTSERNPAGCLHASYADVYEALSILTELPGGKQQYKFAYAVRLLYSIRLHQLLLDETERYTVPEEKNNADGDFGTQPLTSLLADVLFKRKNVGMYGQSYNILHQHYDFSMEELEKNLKKISAEDGKDGRISLESGAFIQQFCRKVVPGKHAYMTRAYPKLEINESRNVKDSTARFHVFYPCLLNLNLLEGAQEGDRREAGEHPGQLRAMVGSMALLLNWDVQYLFRTYYTRRVLQGDEIIDEITNIYCGTAMTKVMEAIATITGDKRYIGQEKIFAIYQMQPSAPDEQAVKAIGEREIALTAIYYTIPELLEREVNQYKKVVEELKEALSPRAKVRNDNNLKAAIGEFSLYRKRLNMYIRFIGTKQRGLQEFPEEFIDISTNKLSDLLKQLNKCLKELEGTLKKLAEENAFVPEPSYSQDIMERLTRIEKAIEENRNSLEIVDKMRVDPPIGTVVARRINPPEDSDTDKK